MRQCLISNTPIAIVGLGYVGLPLAQAFLDAGCHVIGYDTSSLKIDQLRAGGSYISHVPAAWIGPFVQREQFIPTTDPALLARAGAVILCVPSPLTRSRDPDLSFIEAAVREVAVHLRPRQLVSLESTTYPGTTREVVLPVLESSGLTVGEDFFLAYSPEREDPGNTEFSMASIPKVVSGIDVASQDRAVDLYSLAFRHVVPVSSCEVAEACKILENTYRTVNIALVNELKMLFESMGINVWKVISAAKTKPFGFQAFYPGPGIGGHCLPIDPFYLAWLARRYDASARFIELAGEINAAMPQYVLRRLVEALNDQELPLRGARVCLLGVTYKPDVDDVRKSPAFPLIRQLHSAGAILAYHDPYVPSLHGQDGETLPKLTSTSLTAEFLAEQDCILVVTDHHAFDWEFVCRHARLIVDTRNATAAVVAPNARICRA